LRKWAEEAFSGAPVPGFASDERRLFMAVKRRSVPL
jgi:hypothetical protein